MFDIILLILIIIIFIIICLDDNRNTKLFENMIATIEAQQKQIDLLAEVTND